MMSQQPQVLPPLPPPPDETNDLGAKQPGRRLLPNIKVFWIRGCDPRFIRFKKAVLYMGLGQKESGKSALLETVACRYPKIIDIFGCYDEATEVFTKQGWKFFKNITFQDEIATLTIDNNTVEFHKPIAIQNYNYDGQMIHFGGGKHSRYDLLVTPNHNMLVRRGYVPKGKPIFMKAHEILAYTKNHCDALPFSLIRQFPWNCEDVEYFVLPKASITEFTQESIQRFLKAKELLSSKTSQRSRDYHGRFVSEQMTNSVIAEECGVSTNTITKWAINKRNPQNLIHAPWLPKVRIDDWLRFFAWYISEGNPHRIVNNKEKNWYQYRVEICQKSSREKCEEIREAFRRIGLQPKQDGDKIYANSKQLYEYLKPFGYAEQKFLPSWLKNLPSDKLKIYIQTALKGDGNDINCYWTSSKQLADDFQEICLKAGYNATIGFRQPKLGTRINGRLINTKFVSYCISISTILKDRDTELMGHKVVTEKYTGKVYDVTVPNHTLFIRRNGKTAWSGNSRDNEGLAWCRSPFKNSVLFITGDNVDVKSRWDTKSVSEVKLSDFEKYRVVLSCSAFHSGVEAEFHAMNEIVLTLYRRTHWEHLWFLMIREAANFIYSRLKISPNQTIAKADFLYLLREARHMGYPTGVDTLRWTGMDADARGIADYLFIKHVGITGLPKELHFLYAYIFPQSFMGMKPRVFALISNRGPLALGHFDYPWWHKEEKEDMLRLFDIKIEAGDVPDYGVQARNTVSDFEHIRLVGLYLEGNSMQKVAKILSRSPATVNKHISEHDVEVAKTGCCSQCKRVRGMHQNMLLVKRGASLQRADKMSPPPGAELQALEGKSGLDTV